MTVSVGSPAFTRMMTFRGDLREATNPSRVSLPTSPPGVSWFSSTKTFILEVPNTKKMKVTMKHLKKVFMWYKVKELSETGLNKSQIARELGIYRATVRRYLGMEEEEFHKKKHFVYEKELHEINNLAVTINASSLCGLGQASGNPILSLEHHFENDVL